VIRRLALLTAILLAPATADAATVTVTQNTVQFVAAPGELNQVVVTFQAGGQPVTVRDGGGAPLTPSGGCTAIDAVSASCAGTAITAARLDLGDNNDSLTTFAPEVGTVDVTGGPGIDTLAGGRGSDVLDGGDGNDLLDGGEGDDDLRGAANDDGLLGGPGNDRLHGGADTDHLLGHDGDDRLTGAAGVDHLDGGPGNDELVGGEGTDAADPDVLFGRGGDDALTGGDADDSLTGGAGDDTLSAAGGDDQLVGGQGDDGLQAGPGDDELRFTGGGVDRADCDTGHDSVRYPTSGVVLGADCEQLSLDGDPQVSLKPFPKKVTETAVTFKSACRCAATLVLREAGDTHRVLGRGAFAGSRVTVILTAAGREAVKRRRGMLATAIVPGYKGAWKVLLKR
jgi:Ca2+-binding RTX toxin-like protein